MHTPTAGKQLTITTPMHNPKTALALAASSSWQTGERISAPADPPRLAVPEAAPLVGGGSPPQPPGLLDAAAARSAPAAPMVPTWPPLDDAEQFHLERWRCCWLCFTSSGKAFPLYLLSSFLGFLVSNHWDPRKKQVSISATPLATSDVIQLTTPACVFQQRLPLAAVTPTLTADHQMTVICHLLLPRCRATKVAAGNKLAFASLSICLEHSKAAAQLKSEL